MHVRCWTLACAVANPSYECGTPIAECTIQRELASLRCRNGDSRNKETTIKGRLAFTSTMMHLPSLARLSVTTPPISSREREIILRKNEARVAIIESHGSRVIQGQDFDQKGKRRSIVEIAAGALRLTMQNAGPLEDARLALKLKIQHNFEEAIMPNYVVPSWEPLEIRKTQEQNANLPTYHIDFKKNTLDAGDQLEVIIQVTVPSGDVDIMLAVMQEWAVTAISTLLNAVVESAFTEASIKYRRETQVLTNRNELLIDHEEPFDDRKRQRQDGDFSGRRLKPFYVTSTIVAKSDDIKIQN